MDAILLAAAAAFAVVAAVIYLYNKPASYRELSSLARDLNKGSDPPTVWLNLGLWDGARAYPEAAARLAQRTAVAAAVKPGDRVLDVGCGLGESVAMLLSAPFSARSVCGVNLSAVECASARLHLADKTSADSCSIVEADATKLTGVSGPFDAVVCVDSAYHFAPSRVDFLLAASRRLRPGGGVAVSDIVGSGPPTVARRVVSFLSGIPSANTAMDADSYAAALREAGFRDVQVVDITEQVFEPFAAWGRSQSSLRVRIASSFVWRAAAAGGLRFVVASGVKR
eukprot:TRINITY_DN25918_c0_g1_i1.p1 TRINITY_DN25918_c0_g1~~TRINITY_DN25918_c0_g1_i1.p1  ORF type:complete len:300 (+),score=59.79 TRINITY_DN25918_c0_g1_i1:54-902(+)